MDVLSGIWASNLSDTHKAELLSIWPYGISYCWLLGQVLYEAQRREHIRSYVTGVVTEHSA